MRGSYNFRAYDSADGVMDLPAALLDIRDILLKTNPGDERRSVFINDLGVKFTDFELSDQTKRALIDQGRISTTEYLDKPQQPLPEIKRLLRRAALPQKS